MRTVYFKEDRDIQRNVACIGFFDGVHRGHQKLIAHAVSLAREKGLVPTLITFDKDPDSVIDGKEHFQIHSFEERAALYEHFGIEQLIVIPFDKEVMRTPKEAFVRDYLNQMNIDTLICGFDFSFGFKGEGNGRFLLNDPECTFDTLIEEEVTYYRKKISSTRIKDELKKGNITLVNKMLGYEYRKK